MGNNMNFGWLDYCLFLVMFAVSIGIGIYHGFAGRKKTSTESYFMGDRKMKVVPVMLSITVSVISGNTILGCPAEIYMFGINYIFTGLAFALAAVVVSFAFLPLFYPLRVTSVHEYLELRFESKSVRILATILLFLNQSIYVGTVIFGPAIALETATGIPPWGSILLVSILGTAYTTVGGMKAVIWADFFQAFVIIGGMLAVIILGTSRVGGWSQVWQTNQDWDRLQVSMDINPVVRMSLWTALVGNFVNAVFCYGVMQMCAQRGCSMATLKQGQLSMILNGPMFAMLTILASTTGLVVFAFYVKQGCDPLSAGLVSNPNQLLAYFVMDQLSSPGIPGIFMACLFSGALSTLSSCVNSMTAVIWEDILKEPLSHLTEAKKVQITKGLAVIFGLLCMVLAFLVWVIGGNLIQIGFSLTGITSGPLLGLFILGGLFPFAHWIGALSGGLCALAFGVFVVMGQILTGAHSVKLPTTTEGCLYDDTFNMTTMMPYMNATTAQSVVHKETLSPALEWLFSISFAWYGFGGLLVTLVVGAAVSMALVGTDSTKVESRLLFPFLREKYGKETGSKVENEAALQTFPEKVVFIRDSSISKSDQKEPMIKWTSQS